MAEQKRWVDAIGADLASGMRHAAVFAGVMRDGFPGWYARVSGWFRFVMRRRTNERHSVLPRPVAIAEGLAVAASAIVATVLFVDPLFLEVVRGGGGVAKPVFEFITWFGKSDWILIATGIVIVALSLATADRFAGASRVVAHRVFLNAWYLFTTVAFSGLLANLGKNLIGRARPLTLDSVSVWVSSPFADNYAYASFPSGHATTAGAFAMALSLLFPRFRVFFWLAGAWIAISRPALGLHFPSDVLGGFFFGAAFSYVYARSFARKRLLFAFDEDGGLRLRGEGGMTALVGSQLKQAFERLAPPRGS
jgi:undecaprenyl-diphosphatase